jgi:hypothetical protein
MIIDNFGPRGIRETLLKFQRKFRQVTNKLGGRKRNTYFFLKVKAQSSFTNVLNYRVLH